MATEIKERFGIEAKMIKGFGGKFEVRLDDDLIFSKKETGRFPEVGEVVAILEQKNILT